jgi:nitroreductase
MDVAEAIRTKRAVRSFSSEPISEEITRAILNAGRRAQSAKNRQPWEFIAIRDRETLEALSEHGTYAGHLAGAALGVAILTPDPAERWSIMFDAGQAAAYMQLFAWEKGIVSCLATIYEPQKARQLLGFPADRHLNAAISFGYPADPSVLTAPPEHGGRKPKPEIFHFERW